MQIPNIYRYLLSIHVESVLKVFKHFNSLRVWTLGVGFRCLVITLSLILGNFRVNRHSYSFNQNCHITIVTTWSLLLENSSTVYVADSIKYLLTFQRN